MNKEQRQPAREKSFSGVRLKIPQKIDQKTEILRQGQTEAPTPGVFIFVQFYSEKNHTPFCGLFHKFHTVFHSKMKIFLPNNSNIISFFGFLQKLSTMFSTVSTEDLVKNPICFFMKTSIQRVNFCPIYPAFPVVFRKMV